MSKQSSDGLPKNPAAVALGKRRAATLTAEHQSAAGKAAAAKLTADQRRERASRAGKARWLKSVKAD